MGFGELNVMKLNNAQQHYMQTSWTDFLLSWSVKVENMD
jgi:hypothetical protein